MTFNSAGKFWFQATYSGDANNPVPAGGFKSVCTSEPIVVSPNTPSINTVIKTGTAPNDTAISNPVSVPITVHDTATLTGATADAGGTVTYKLYTDNTCTTLSTTPALNATVNVTNGVVPNSPNVTFNSAGSWCFQATYSGDNEQHRPGQQRLHERADRCIAEQPSTAQHAGRPDQGHPDRDRSVLQRDG